MQTMIVSEEIVELLEQLGLTGQEKGFERLSCAIAVTAQKFERAGSVTKLLYPDLAKHFQTTPEKIEILGKGKESATLGLAWLSQGEVRDASDQQRIYCNPG